MRFRKDERGRVSFAVIAIIILVTSTFVTVYYQSIERDLSDRPDVPAPQFNSIIGSVEIEITGMAKDSLGSALDVLRSAMNGSLEGWGFEELITEYENEATMMFETRFQDRFNGTRVMDGVNVEVSIQTSSGSLQTVFPIYDTFMRSTELGDEEHRIPIGFQLMTDVTIRLEDTDSQMTAEHGMTVEAEIYTDIPLVLDLVYSIDLSSFDMMVSTMAKAVAFARLYGDHGQDIGLDLENLPKPGENLTDPVFDMEGDVALGFRSDRGPLEEGQLLSEDDMVIIRDLAFILIQLRSFGMWDDGFVISFLQKVGSNSISEEGRSMTEQDLRTMIGEGEPNFVNIEALVLGLFHRMGLVPRDINIVGPQLRKMMDHGFMGLYDEDFDEYVSELLGHPYTIIESMLDEDGWPDDGWFVRDHFIPMGYKVMIIEFFAIALWHIIKAYHLDEQDEIKEFVEYIIDKYLDEGFLKYVPEKVTISLGGDLKVELEVRDKFKGITKGAIDLAAGQGVPLFGMELNGYTLVYLFIAMNERYHIDEEEILDSYMDVFDNWTKRIQDFIEEMNLSRIGTIVEANEKAFEDNRSDIATLEQGLLALDLSMNQTMNNSLGEIVHRIGLLQENLTQISSPMRNEVSFFTYGEGIETQAWRDLEALRQSTVGAKGLLQTSLNHFKGLVDSNDAASPEHSEAKKVENWLQFIIWDTDFCIFAIEDQLREKWQRDVLDSMGALVGKAGATETSAGNLYEAIMMLSMRFEPHPCLGFEGSIEEMASEMAQATREVKGFHIDDDELSLKSILDDDVGVMGLMTLLKDNVRHIRRQFVSEMTLRTCVTLVQEEEEDWAAHGTYDKANERLMYQSYLLSMASTRLVMETVNIEIGSFEGKEPVDILKDEHGSFQNYSELSYLKLKYFALDALIYKLEQLDEIFDTTEAHPGLLAEFGHVRRGGEGPLAGARLIDDMDFDFEEGHKAIARSGLRVFRNSTSTAHEDVCLQYLNPFSKDWYDYYLTSFSNEVEGNITLGLKFNDTVRVDEAGSMVDQEVRTGLNVSYLATGMLPSPLPALDMPYRPVGPILRRSGSANIDRNVFSNKVKEANVNFTYSASGDDDDNQTSFKVQVSAKIKTLAGSLQNGLSNIIEDQIMEELSLQTENTRELTNIIPVKDNGNNDTDPRPGHVSVPVKLKINRLKSTFGPLVLMDSTPILIIKVWRPMTYKVLVSDEAWSRVSGGSEVFQSVPSIEVREQGFFFFVDEYDPVLPVFDVGEGNEEVRVPVEIYSEDIWQAMSPSVRPSHFDDDPNDLIYSKDHPRLGSLYDLTCRFKVITDIPSDSMIYFNKRVPLLVDFDGGHMYMRSLVFEGLMDMKGVSKIEMDLFNTVMPTLTLDTGTIKVLVPSEYKFARTYEFTAIYLQYFQGYRPWPDPADLLEGKDVVLSWNGNPDLYHLPYRVIPINLDRGPIVRSLWSDLIDEMEFNNFTLKFFVPDIIKTLLKEMKTWAGALSDKDAGLMEGDRLSFCKDIKTVLAFRSFMKDAMAMEYDPGSVIFSSPGARKGFDLGANFYLGFDVAPAGRNTDMELDNDLIMFLVGAIGLYTDLKTWYHIAMEAKKISKYVTNLEGKEKKDTKTKDPENVTYENYGFLDAFKEVKGKFGLFFQLHEMIKDMTEGKSGRSAWDYLPPLFGAKELFNISDEGIREAGELAWEVEYDLVDVVLLRYQNRFSVSEVKEMKKTRGIGQKGAHGITCVEDLGPNDYGNFREMTEEDGIPLSEYCTFGHQNMSSWDKLLSSFHQGAPLEQLRKAAVLGLPFEVVDHYMTIHYPLDDILKMAKKASMVGGHEAFFEDLGQDPTLLAILELAAEHHKNKNIFIRPNGTEGPDIYVDGKFLYIYPLLVEIRTYKDADTYITDLVLERLREREDWSWVYIDTRWTLYYDLNSMYTAIVSQYQDLDPKGHIQKYIFITRDGSSTIYRVTSSQILYTSDT